MRSNIVLVVANMLNSGSYLTFDKLWTKSMFQAHLQTDSPSSETAAALVLELGQVVRDINGERLQVIITIVT